MVKEESKEYIAGSKERLIHNPHIYFIATIIGIVLYLVLDIIAQLLPPHYSFITQAESDLAVGPYGIYIRKKVSKKYQISLKLKKINSKYIFYIII